MALNLEDPWYITRIDFSAEGKQLDIHVDFESGSKFPCAKCGNPGCSVHDTIERTWRHLNFFQFKTYIHCRVPRTICEDCGVKQSKVPWTRKGSGFTLLMDSLIVLVAQHMTVTAIAEMIDDTYWCINILDWIWTKFGIRFPLICLCSRPRFKSFWPKKRIDS